MLRTLKLLLTLAIFALFVSALPNYQKPVLSADCSSVDFNGDGKVDGADSQAFAFHVFPAPYDPKYDLNRDGKVDAADTEVFTQVFPNCLPPVAPAQLPDSPAKNGFTAQNLIGQLVTSILPIVLGIGGFLTVIIIVISGIQFITSSGNPEAAAAARSRLIFALVGFIIIILAFSLTQIIDKIFLGGSGIFQ